MKITRYGLIAIIALVNSTLMVNAAPSHLIIPEPHEIKVTDGQFALSQNTVIIAPETLKNEAVQLRDTLAPATGFKLAIQDKASGSQISLALDPSLKDLGKEGYTLRVTKAGISIKGLTSTGVFYGTQSLIQLLPPEITSSNKANVTWSIPFVSIEDQPRFAWRGFMLDEARWFKGEEEVIKLIDQMAALKMNTFHWHLTDDQGWRIEIKKYPKLTEIGSKRADTQMGGWNSPKRAGKPHAGFYTQEQIKSIVKYAAERHITIVPEIGMPGHACAAIAAYPWLGTKNEAINVPVEFGKHYHTYNPASEKVYQVMSDIFDEIIALFPSKIIHIGGDEVRFDHWKENSEIKALMEKEGLKSMADVQIYFTNRIAKIVESKGRNIMGWNEIMGENVHGGLNSGADAVAASLSPDTVVHFWRGSADLAKRAIKKGHKIVNSWHAFTYLDYGYGSISLRKAYAFDPVFEGLSKEEEKQIIGSGCQMWGEWIPTVEDMEKKVYPRLAAFAEVGWTDKTNKNFASFSKRIDKQHKRWDNQGIGYATETGAQYMAQDFFNHVKIDSWSPENISKDWQKVEFSTGEMIKSATTYEVVFLWERSNEFKNFLMISEVALLENGEEVAIDKHDGTSGKNLNHVIYKLTLPKLKPGACYTLRARIKGAAGNQSKGEVKILPKLQES